jgi:demethylmenaquinone methyltransferase/2-methoxy-6-polyprenyl-1,4-benzoquinol methylase
MNKGLQKIYSEISLRYELTNHILTLGLDIICRKRTARAAADGGGAVWLDICSGTGEMVFQLNRLKPENAFLIAADFSLPMVGMGLQKRSINDIPFVITDAAALPFKDNTFDLVTISFATRNISPSKVKLIEHLHEFLRVLKPGGRLINLETSQPRWGVIRRLMHLYVKVAVRPVGTVLTGSAGGYVYLAKSIPLFYSAEKFAQLLREAGFSEVTFKRMFMGITAVHKAVR